MTNHYGNDCRPGHPTASDAAAQIEGLCSEYRTARSQIDSFADPIERELGLATLRREANETYRFLVTSGHSLGDADLAQLRHYVAANEGGELADLTLDQLDDAVAEASSAVAKDVITATATGNFGTAGIITTAAAIFTWWTGALQQVGQDLATLLLLGSIPIVVYMVRGFGVLADAAQAAASRGWAWALDVGVGSDQALLGARTSAVALSSQFGSGLGRQGDLTLKARRYAMTVVLVISGIALVSFTYIALGIISVLDGGTV